MEEKLPKIDLPEDWVIGTDISRELLSLYTNYPLRLKCEIFVLCMSGEVDASVNLNRIAVRANDVVTLTPGSVFQIHRVEGDLKIYFLGFSSQCVEQADRSRSIFDAMHLTLARPVVSLKPQGARMLEEYLCMVIRMYTFLSERIRKSITPNLYADIHTGLSLLYSSRVLDKHSISKSEQISCDFSRLVMLHYTEVRNVSWYAERLGITHAHLCNTVKQATGRTCVEIISSMVIMDAKAQLKSTRLSIQEIAEALHFANMSFFGKYFKRYVGMSPLEYRNKG